MGKKVLVFLGHTNDRSLCAGLADAYVAGGQEQSKEVRLVRLNQLKFNPALDLDAPDNLEPDLAQLQNDFAWADHIVLIYPIWWGAAPGLMKCALERILLSGFAFKFRSKGSGWDRLLSNRTGELIVTMDTPPSIYRWLFGAAGDRIMAKRTLEFCGIKCLRTTHFGPVRSSSEQQRLTWISKVKELDEKCERGNSVSSLKLRIVMGVPSLYVGNAMIVNRLDTHTTRIGLVMKMKYIILWIGLVFTALVHCGAVQADVRLPAVFSDHMVLQQQQKIRVWGWAEAGESVTVSLAATLKPPRQSKVGDGKWNCRP